MITLEFKDGSELDDRLWELYKNILSTNNTSFSIFTMEKWIATLEYVHDYEYRPAAEYQNTLIFETEEDKMFFILKYS